LRSLLAGSTALLALSTAWGANAQTLTVDAANSPRGNPHFWSTAVGTGTASLTLRADLQTHYKLARRELGMQRVRGHGVLNDDMEIFNWSGGSAAPTFTWTKFDRYLDAIAAAGMRPAMELSFMPAALATAGDSRNPPKDHNVYRQLIQAVVARAVEKFGAEDVSQWYWEVWNEPNYAGFWTGTMEDYFTMYDAAAAGAVAALPNIKIGGPVTTQGSTSQMTAFLQHVEQSGARVTFLASHAYPGGEGSNADATFGVSDNNGRVGVITGQGFTTDELESLNTEWNSAYTGQGGNMTPNNVSMDSHANAPFILKSVKLLADQVQGDKPPLSVFAYWVVSDVFGEYGSDAGSYIEQQGGTLPFGSVFGLMTYQGVRKAAWNAFKMLDLTGTKRLAVTGGSGNGDGVDAMATINADNSEVAIIVYNYYQAIGSTGAAANVTVNVNNLPFAGSNIFVTKFGIDAEHSNPYGVWVSQGKPTAPNEPQWQAMRQAQHLALLTPVETEAGAATYSTTLTLPRQGAAMILLGKKRPVTGRDGLEEIEAEDYDGHGGVTKEESGDTSMGQSIAANASTFVNFYNVDFSDSGVDNVELRVNTQGAAILELRSGQGGPLISACLVPHTGGMWTTQNCELTHTTGVHNLYANFSNALRLNSMKFKLGEGGGGMGGMGGMAGMAGSGGMVIGGAGGVMTAGAGGMPSGGTPSIGGAGGTTATGGAVNGGSMPTSGSGPANGGNPSSGGAPATNGGAGASSSTTNASSGDSSGCGCRVTPERASPFDKVGLLGLTALGRLLRRRARSQSSVAQGRP
jgi:xylan 1,4-beta-xylosidase